MKQRSRADRVRCVRTLAMRHRSRVEASGLRQRSGAFTVCFPSWNDILFVCARTLAELVGAWQPPFQKNQVFLRFVFMCSSPSTCNRDALAPCPHGRCSPERCPCSLPEQDPTAEATFQNTKRLTSPTTMPRTPPSGFRKAIMWPSLIHRELLLFQIVHTREKKTRADRGDCTTMVGGARWSRLTGLLRRPLFADRSLGEPTFIPEWSPEAPLQNSPWQNFARGRLDVSPDLLELLHERRFASSNTQTV